MQEMLRAERDCHGNLIDPAKRREFGLRYGFSHGSICRGLFRQSRATRMYWASHELKEWWRRNGYTTFEQWAYHSGFRHKFIVEGLRARR